MIRLKKRVADRKDGFEQAAEALKSVCVHAGSGAGFRETWSDSHFPIKFPRSFPQSSHLLKLAGGFWDSIGQIRRRSDDLHHEGEASRFR